MHVKADGKRYEVVFAKHLMIDGVRLDGACDAPDVRNRRILLDNRLTDEDLLETVIHEHIHASAWFLTEEKVTEMAEDLKNVLWRMGYRLPQNWREKTKIRLVDG